VQCLACGEQNPDRARFCLNCGTQLGPSTALDTGPREVRKTVTVLFADMVGFTSLGERLDGESLRRVMDRFYSEMRAAIEHEHGTVAKFIGDAVMAVWGMRAVAEDDALRAVRAAEGMRSRLAALNEDLDRRWGVRIGLRTGVNTGEVVVDPTMSADLLVGDTVNVAARLEQAAPDGAVYVGEDTYRLVRDDVHLDAVAPLRLKGKARPVNAWRLVDGRRAERRRAARLQAPLVGREREVARLRSAFYAAAADRRTKLVTVIGSPGVGKSRLTAEFGEGLGGEAIVLEGRCEVSGEGLTFLPIAEVLRSATGIGEDDGLEDAKLKLSALLPEDRDRDRIVERSMALLGLTPAVGVEETFWAVRRLLGALARMRPVVLVLDDVQWAQPTLLDLHEHLVVWGKDAPVLVVAVARPELRETRPSLTVPGPMVTDVIELAPLAAADSRALVERLLGEADLPPELAERVLETTEGNPLFLGEMLRMLVDDGVVRRDGDRWVVREDGASFSVPPTVNALLAARIERLTPDERCVVERAAVIGQQFYRGAVAELSPAGVAADVDAHLDRLRRKELVGPEGTVWIDEPVFRFHHVLIRDAAYRALLKESRADLHERYADWLEGKTGEVEELVAFHLERAVRVPRAARAARRARRGARPPRGRAAALRRPARARARGSARGGQPARARARPARRR
jgi:class 3 adenylate cyclase